MFIFHYFYKYVQHLYAKTYKKNVCTVNLQKERLVLSVLASMNQLKDF